MDGVTNNDIIKFYSNKPAYSDLFKSTIAYRKMRIRCEICEKSIQNSNKTYNVFKLLRQKENVRNKKDSLFYRYICDEENRRNMNSFSALELDETDEMLSCTSKYAEYNEKWHLFIAYYALSEYDKETKEYNLPELILDEQHVVTNWNLKGNKHISDPLLLLWMTEAADVIVPPEINKYIDELQNKLCKHATNEDDKNLINMFNSTLWNEVASKIKEVDFV